MFAGDAHDMDIDFGKVLFMRDAHLSRNRFDRSCTSVCIVQMCILLALILQVDRLGGGPGGGSKLDSPTDL